MKCLYTFLALIASACLLGAGEVSVTAEDTSSAGAVTVTVPAIKGSIDAILVDVGASTTNTILVTSAFGPVLSVSGVTADAAYRPRIVGTDTNGAALSGVISERIYIDSERLSVVVTATQAALADATVRIKYK